jgi:NitT/TauT family transport system ATP-binding protein
MTADTIAATPDKATAAYIDFQNVSMTFPDGTHAVDDVSFEVRQGEFVTVVGPSGCGKSTLLRIASGLTKQTGGTIIGNPREMGYVFQDATLLQWRTVQRNVQLFAELENVPKKERQQRVSENIELVGLVGHEDKYPKQLSGGMKMRVSLARSLVMEPSMFLFDEPFGALDEITREFLNDELLSLFKAKQFGALFITHSIYEAVFLSTRVLVMSSRPGRIVASFDIPFPYPRTPDLRFGSEFADIAGEVSHALRGAHE